MMQLFAIFGDPVSHSRSPLMHNAVFKNLHYDACYTRVHLKDGSQLRSTFVKLNLQGANITVPHKEEAFKACDEIRGFAQSVGVVNTIVKEGDKLIGYNTDADGFMFAIKEFNSAVNTILVLGAGGTAKALCQKFQLEGKKVTVLNRSEERLQTFKNDGFTTYTHNTMPTESFDLIVNTTSAGLQDENYPAPLELLSALLQKSTFAADAIYGKKTPFLKLCDTHNIKNIDGAAMLLGQGVLANHYFCNETLSLNAIEEEMQKSFLL